MDYLPLTALLTVLRGIAIDGKTPSVYPTELLILAGWIVISFVLAWKTFRFDRG